MLYINELKDIVGNDYLTALIVLVVFLLLSKFVVYIIEKVFMRIARKTETLIDDLILKIIHRPIFFVLILLGILIALNILGLDKGEDTITYNIVYSIFILILGYMASKIFNLFVQHWGSRIAKRTKSTIDDQLVGLFESVGVVIAWAIAIIFVFQIWNINVAPFVASLGIAGVAIAFALQSSLGNVFGGISLIIDKSIRVGDVVELDDKTSGTILNVGLRSTKIRTWNNEVLIIPNGKLADAKIINYVQPEDTVRVVVPFSVSYGSNINEVKKLVLAEIKKVSAFSENPEPFVVFKEMADSSLNFTAYFYVKSYTKRFMAKDEANTNIYNTLNKNNIEIPFPQIDVHVKEAKADAKKAKAAKKTVAKNVRKPVVKSNAKGQFE